jgi:outer membrane protein assembly factor BamB
MRRLSPVARGCGCVGRLALVAALATLLAAQAPVPALEPWTFVQLSDPHVGAAAGLPHLRVVLAEIEKLSPKPRLVVVTGDLTEKGDPREFRQYREEVEAFTQRSSIPVLSALGNHDARWNPLGRRELGGEPWPRALVLGDLGFLALDSSLTFGQHGHLSRRQLADALAAIASRPQAKDWIVALHHPPGHGSFLDDPALPLELLARAPVCLVLTGHGHAHRHWDHGGVPHVMAIGVMNPRFGYRLFRVEPQRITGKAIVLGGDTKEDLVARRGGRRSRESPAASQPASRLSGQRFDAAFLCAPLVHRGLLVVAAEEGDLFALDPRTLRPRWRRTLAPPCWTSPIADGERILVADGKPALHWLDTEGEIVTSVDLAAPATSVAVHDRAPVWTLTDGSLVRLDAGKPRLLGRLPSWSRGGALPLGRRWLAATWDRHAHLLDPDGGALQSFVLTKSFYSSAATATPLPRGDGALLFGHDHRVVQLGPDGAVQGEWRLEEVQPGYSGGVLLAPDRLLVGSLTGSLVLLDLETNKLVQRIELGGAVFDSTPVVAEGIAWVGTMAGELVGARLADGQVVQRVRLGGYVVADPVVSGGAVFAVSTTGSVARAETGR